jgi:hypothetical protein
MLLDFIVKVGHRIKAAATSIKTKIMVLIRRPESVALRTSQVRIHSLVSGTGCSMNKGQWCQLTSSHAPIFSLFTYFGDRQ